MHQILTEQNRIEIAKYTDGVATPFLRLSRAPNFRKFRKVERPRLARNSIIIRLNIQHYDDGRGAGSRVEAMRRCVSPPAPLSLILHESVASRRELLSWNL